MPVPTRLAELIERFERNKKFYTSPAYNETQLREEFVNPFFEALGWDVRNIEGRAEAYKDVIHEDAIRIGQTIKAPDYSFRVGGQRKFFVETKKPSVNIKADVNPAYQIRRYSWSAKLPLAILTDFEEFAVYDCRKKPLPTDNASVGRVLYLSYDEYEKRWGEIENIFSKQAILQGLFDQYSESTKAKKGTSEVDDEFLKEIELWRDELARNIALRNPKYSVREINYAIQKTVDRIIFLRICEDRGIEPYGQLREISKNEGVYKHLLKLFEKADEKYDSGLFYFKEEKGRTAFPDYVCPNLKIDDKVFKDIIKNLYFPDCPYEFSVIGADILGNVYEQFLGKVIRLTEGHRAKVEEKPEVKKAGGVYYTPKYIVDYIVENTVGKLIDGKTPKQVEGLKVLDPACGSGSFLIGAYQRLLDYHRDWYVSRGPAKHKDVIYQGAGGLWFLTLKEKKRILLNNIYGVDIDEQAVEVAKLNLLLKVLEDEHREPQKRLGGRVLPDLDQNIKCGNSLIGPDYYTGQTKIYTEEETLHINVFDWNKEFPHKFDAIIGNPPYVRQEMLGEFKPYFESHYEAYHGVADLYVYFIEKGVSLLADGGIYGIIVANKWMRANYGRPLRAWMKNRCIEEITDFGDLPVFKKATTYPCILSIADCNPKKTFHATKVESLDFASLGDYVRKNQYKVSRQSLDDAGWSLADEASEKLLKKLKDKGVPLKEYVNAKIYRGVLTGLNEAFVINEETKNRIIQEDPKSEELIKPFLVGKDIKRYFIDDKGRYLILIPKGWTREHAGGKNPWNWFSSNYSAVAKHLIQFKEKAEKRYDKGEYWWELRTCDYYQEFEKPKILWPGISAEVTSFAFDKDSFYGNDNNQLIISDDLYLLGILNSKLTRLILTSICDRVQGGFYRLKIIYVQQIPIPAIDYSNSKEKGTHDSLVSLVSRMLDFHKRLSKVKTPQEKSVLERQIEAADDEINQLVYKLYGLTGDEIRIVEEGN